jgi:BirA family transcriptional regulator, biotin operon repressor / biotin---[acetyl-CoA-carboxylase] ligase
MILDLFKSTFSICKATAIWFEKNSIPCNYYENIDSTNNVAKIEALNINEHSKAYLAKNQSAGRGRGSNLWQSPNGADALLSSWSFKLDSAPQAITGPLFGLAVYNALSKTFPNVQFAIKAPNDIYIHDKKIAGLLAEVIRRGTGHRLIVGLGMNIFSHPESLPDAGHLSQFTKVKKNDWGRFLSDLNIEFLEASRASLATHLTVNQRDQLLVALNQYMKLSEPYISVSPFADLATKDKNLSWREI